MLIRLDERLSAVASLVDYGTVADVGCDHGKLGFYLLGTDRASKVIATDISAKSLKKASELAYENDLDMQTRLGDGLAPVGSGEADTVVIAGLGGDVISDILARAREEGKRFAHYVLSPNTHPEKVRSEIVKQGHEIVYDGMIECAGKRYTLIKTREGEQEIDDLQIAFGAFYRTSETFLRLAKEELAYKQSILKDHFSNDLQRRVNMLARAIENAEREQKNGNLNG